MNEWMNEWTNEWMNEWTNESVNQKGQLAVDHVHQVIVYLPA